MTLKLSIRVTSIYLINHLPGTKSPAVCDAARAAVPPSRGLAYGSKSELSDFDASLINRNRRGSRVAHTYLFSEGLQWAPAWHHQDSISHTANHLPIITNATISTVYNYYNQRKHDITISVTLSLTIPPFLRIPMPTADIPCPKGAVGRQNAAWAQVFKHDLPDAWDMPIFPARLDSPPSRFISLGQSSPLVQGHG